MEPYTVLQSKRAKLLHLHFINITLAYRIRRPKVIICVLEILVSFCIKIALHLYGISIEHYVEILFL